MSAPTARAIAVAKAHLELARRRRMGILGVDMKTAIPDDMSFREWCDLQSAKGMKVDGKPFSLDDRPALIPIYEAIPTTREEAARRILVVQKATQLGLTVWEVLANIYMALKFEPITIGMFMPDQATATFKSEHRFMRIVRTLPNDIYRRFTHRADTETGQSRRKGEGNVLTRVMGESIFLFLWTSGRVSTESRPMDVVTLDEVQEMALDEIDKVMARMGDSELQFSLLLSTANMPELDINFWYMLGTQEVWHTECPSCGVFSDLSDPATNFPGCVAYNTGQIDGAPLNEYVYACPSCGGYIKDAQRGRYIPQNPAAAGCPIRSILAPRTISPRMTPGDLITRWNRAVTGDQKKSFYNRTLARPYIDQDQLPVTLEHCRLCAEEGARAGVAWARSAMGAYMGIDQMGGFNAVIVKTRMPDNRQATVHVEAVFDADPFERCAAMMDEYGVEVCVVEQLPNVNDARRFANRFPGRVFLAGYSDLKDDFMVWGDAMSRTDKKTADDERTRYTVTLNQYKCMQTSLHRIRNQHCLFPDPNALEQDVVEKGERRRIAILRDWVFTHFTKTALVVEQDDDTRRPRPKVMKVGIDPHFSYANMLCDVAWARQHGASSFIIPPSAAPKIPGLDGTLQAIFDEAGSLDGQAVCGNCTAYREGVCSERGFAVRAGDSGCFQFISAGG